MVGMTDLRGRRGGRYMVIHMDMVKAKGKSEGGVLMLMRRCPNLRLAELRRRAEGC
jgi:hypothetical protein